LVVLLSPEQLTLALSDALAGRITIASVAEPHSRGGGQGTVPETGQLIPSKHYREDDSRDHDQRND
jgi:hypothetical protein